MARICHSCGKRPAFGQSRSHSMVATKRRFDANLQKVRISDRGRPEARLRLHPLPQGGEGHEGVAGRPLLADPSLVRFRSVVQRSLAELEARREEVNDLNVFPVADGDTGDNMALTLRAVLDELDRLSGAGALDEIGREEIVDSRGPRGAARRARQLRRHPLPADPRRGRGAGLAARASSSTRC